MARAPLLLRTKDTVHRLLLRWDSRPAHVDVPVLAYHGVDEDESPLSTPPTVFRAHMDVLASLGYTTVTLQEANANIARQDRSRIVISFDDGYRSVLRNAAPILSEYGFRATLFPVAGRLGKPMLTAGSSVPLPDAPVVSGAELIQWCGAGHDVGSHTMSHLDLREISNEALVRELCTSRDCLANVLGRDVNVLSYPFGLWNRRVAEATRHARYEVAVTMDSGWACPGHAPLTWPRVAIGPWTTPDALRNMVTRTAHVYFAMNRLFMHLFADPTRGYKVRSQYEWRLTAGTRPSPLREQMTREGLAP